MSRNVELVRGDASQRLSEKELGDWLSPFLIIGINPHAFEYDPPKID